MRVLILLSALVLLSGCSSWANKASHWTSTAVASTGDLIAPIEVKQQQDDLHWLIQQQFNEPPVLDSMAFDFRARQLCPKGYLKDEVYAQRPAKFAVDPAECTTADCRYTLVWKIHCDEVPREPFSIFGKF
jgi:hypothetical protein